MFLYIHYHQDCVAKLQEHYYKFLCHILWLVGFLFVHMKKSSAELERSRAEVDPRARTFFRPPPMRVLRSVALLWSVCEWSVATYVQPTQQPGRHLQQQQQQQQRRRQQQRRSLPVVCSESTKKKVRVAPWQAAACTPLTCSALCTSDRLTPVTRSGCGHGTGHLHLSGPRCH